MQHIQQLQTIEALLKKIKWPEGSEIYYTIGHNMTKQDCSISIYVSDSIERQESENVDAFGKYLSIIAESLSFAINKLEALLEVKYETN